MIVVLPFNYRDAAQAAAMLDWCADLCGQQSRTIILAHEELTPSDDVQRAASRAFSTVEHLIVSTCMDSWPGAANCYFGCVAVAMRGREEWLWMEADCVPTSPRAFDRLEADYQRCGKPVLGTVVPAYFNKGGQWIETGKMLIGVAIYHPNLWDHSPLLQCLRATQAAYAKANAIPKAFDCYLAPEILPSAATTPLLQHMGRSREFRRNGQQIICTYGAESRWSTVVAPETVFVHGCKDDSLITLLRAEMGISEGKKNAISTAKIIQAVKVQPKADTGFQWEDDSKPKAKESAPSVAQDLPPAAKVAASAVNYEALATLADARKSVQHWPDCKAAVYGLHEARGRYRVACECGASSAKLAEGINWEIAWTESAQQTPEVKPTINGIPASRRTAAITKTFDDMVAQETAQIAPEIAPLDPAEPKPPIPIHKLRNRCDIIAQYPEWDGLTKDQLRIKVNQLKARTRKERMAPVTKALTQKTERFLTPQARARKLELLAMCIGKKGAWFAVRRIAEGLAIQGTKVLKKDALIIAILEREFESPYQEFEAAEV